MIVARRLFVLLALVASLLAVQSAAASNSPNMRIDPGRTYDNPFDPDQIAIDANFTGPDGKALVLPAYWDGQAGFVVRFAAPMSGDWTMSIVAKDAQGTRESPTQNFQVAPFKSKGFVRRAIKNDRYLQFDSGDAYFMIGLNIAWPDKRGLKSYEEDFTSLGKAGGNFARVWMANPKMETLEAGLGKYDLAACENYDRLFE